MEVTGVEPETVPFSLCPEQVEHPALGRGHHTVDRDSKGCDGETKTQGVW
jgi:hypothetical protein